MDDDRVPESEWVWCGYPGHFVAAHSCRMHLHTRVGDYRVSTVGDYRPHGEDAPQPIGAGYTFETEVFAVENGGEHNEGLIRSWSALENDVYQDGAAAERGHMEMCRKYASAETESAPRQEAR